MNITTEIKEAIEKSISQTDVVRVHASDLDAAYAEVSAISDDCDRATMDDGSVDVWGELDGQSFRIRIASL